MFQMLKVSDLKASTVNPRFEVTEIAELAQSIKTHGVIEPLVVSHEIDGSHVILAGHRRHAAAIKAGLKELPCIIRDKLESHTVIHLVENLQRVDLTPMETAISVAGAMERGQMKAKELAKQVSRSPAWVSKFTTIHKAWVKLEKDKKESTLAQFVQTGDADKLYAAARKVLGLDKTEVQGNLGLEKEKDDEENSDNESAEIEVIAALRGMLKGMERGGVADVEPHGKSGFRLHFTFKNEKAARDWIEQTKGGK